MKIQYKFYVILLVGFIFMSTLEAQPLSKIPDHIVYEDNSVTLFADYAGRKPEQPSIKLSNGSIDAATFSRLMKNSSVPVYLVNNTNESIELMTEDGDVYLKLEYMTNTGEWARAQTHSYSWCGNSYIKTTLGAYEFMELMGYQSPSIDMFAHTKTSSEIRFSMKNSDFHFVSNSGMGFVTDEDVKRSRIDDMAIMQGDITFVENIAMGVGLDELIKPAQLRVQRKAIRRFTSKDFDLHESLEALERIKEKTPELIADVRRAINQITQTDSMSSQGSR